MSFKDLGKHVEHHEEKPGDAELRERAAARHKAKEEKGAKAEEHGAAKPPPAGGTGKGGPQK